ncbi:MAG TPA: hypothetical protein ENN13_05590 [Candidatus Altiarchaeales archaeon]|nr:hypothetical protein [Candidatus Altiarchaeales archaeon]
MFRVFFIEFSILAVSAAFTSVIASYLSAKTRVFIDGLCGDRFFGGFLRVFCRIQFPRLKRFSFSGAGFPVFVFFALVFFVSTPVSWSVLPGAGFLDSFVSSQNPLYSSLSENAFDVTPSLKFYDNTTPFLFSPLGAVLGLVYFTVFCLVFSSAGGRPFEGGFSGYVKDYVPGFSGRFPKDFALFVLASVFTAFFLGTPFKPMLLGLSLLHIVYVLIIFVFAQVIVFTWHDSLRND